LQRCVLAAARPLRLHCKLNDPMKFEAILFDCDGVLVDSEPITNGVLREMLVEEGWSISKEECEAIFIGHTVRELSGLIKEKTGKPWRDEWLQQFYKRRNDALDQYLQIMPGALQAVESAQQYTGNQIACASGADRFKIGLQLQKVGLYAPFQNRIFSGHEMPKSKPAPDVYLAAMRHLNTKPNQCLVIEDTGPGATAGIAAGATVWGLCPFGDGRAFKNLNIDCVFKSMHDLPILLQQHGTSSMRKGLI